MHKTPKIYLAGPDVFRQDAKEHGEELKKKCSLAGFEGLFPTDGEIDEELNGVDRAKAIYAANIRLIQDAGLVIANVSPFRGPGMDAGTAFEIGFALALQKPVIGYASNIGDYADRVPHRLNTEKNIRIAEDGMIVEDFGLCENLMIAIGADDIVGGFDEALKAAQIILEH
jgi:nucleoside deoxyribosyltransferase